MRIIVWGINYSPEPTGIAPCNTALCEFLADRGHEVEMVTTFSYYPDWKKRPDDAGRLFRTDRRTGVKIHRCWHYVPAKVTVARRILHEGSFVATSFARALALKRADVCVVVSPPLLLGLAAAVLSRLKKVPYVFHVQDLQPDAAVSLGLLRRGLLTRALYGIEAIAYRHAARVSGISRAMIRVFEGKGLSASDCVYCPNGTVLPAEEELPVPGRFRARQGFEADDFLLVYSGNLGVKQGLDILLEAAQRLREDKVRIVICGDGSQRTHLSRTIQEWGLKNVSLLPLQDAECYREMLVDSDVCVIIQKHGSGQWFFPSKLLPALAFKKAILTVADAGSELATIVEENRCGINVAPGRPEELARAIRSLSGRRGDLPALGQAGRRYVAQFEMSRVLADFESVLVRVQQEYEIGARSAAEA